MPSRKEVRALAEAIHAWNEAKIDPVVISMRFINIDEKTYRRAMKIVCDELIPAASARQVDEEFKQRGRYLNAQEVAEAYAKMEAEGPPGLSAGDRARLADVAAEVVQSIRNDYPNLTDGEEAVKIFKARLAARALQ
jgi:hypothetical protein